MTSKLPRSRAKTAYGLLSDVARIITEEPKRFDMRVWMDQRSAVSTADDYYPACGTVGCIGGWTEVLAGAHVGYASRVLGLTPAQAAELFVPRGYNQGAGQTAAHARKYVAHIRRFQEKYAAQLKATKVTPR